MKMAAELDTHRATGFVIAPLKCPTVAFKSTKSRIYSVASAKLNLPNVQPSLSGSRGAWA